MLSSVKALVRQSASQGGCWLNIPLASSDHFQIPSVQTSPSIVVDKLSLDFVPIWALFAFVERMSGETSRSAPALLPKPPGGARSKATGGVSRQIPPSQEKRSFSLDREIGEANEPRDQLLGGSSRGEVQPHCLHLAAGPRNLEVEFELPLFREGSQYHLTF